MTTASCASQPPRTGVWALFNNSRALPWLWHLTYYDDSLFVMCGCLAANHFTLAVDDYLAPIYENLLFENAYTTFAELEKELLTFLADFMTKEPAAQADVDRAERFQRASFVPRELGP